VDERRTRPRCGGGSQHDVRQRPAPDLVERCFRAERRNQLRVADIAYIPTLMSIHTSPSYSMCSVAAFR
jgi:hypothetical protein